MKNFISFLATLVIIGFSSCKNSNSSEENSQGQMNKQTNENEQLELSSKLLEVDENNAIKIEEDVIQRVNDLIIEKGIDEISEIIALYRPEDEYAENAYYTYTLTEQKLDNNITQIVLTETGLADDSVEGIRAAFSLIKEGEYYQITSIYEQYRCWTKRGSQAWSKEFCI